MMEGEVAAFFQMGAAGAKAWNSFIIKQYKLITEWNFKLKSEPDNLDFSYNVRYYRTRYGWYKKLY